MAKWNGNEADVADKILNYVKNLDYVEIMPKFQVRIIKAVERDDETMEFVCDVPRYKKISLNDNYDYFILQVNEYGEAYNPIWVCDKNHNNDKKYNRVTGICPTCKKVMCMCCTKYEIDDNHKKREEVVCRDCYSKWVYGKTTGLAISMVAGVVLMIYLLLLGEGIVSIGFLFWPFMLRYWQFMTKGFLENEVAWVFKTFIWVIVSGLVSIFIVFPAYQCIMEIKERKIQIRELKAEQI